MNKKALAWIVTIFLAIIVAVVVCVLIKTLGHLYNDSVGFYIFISIQCIGAIIFIALFMGINTLQK